MKQLVPFAVLFIVGIGLIIAALRYKLQMDSKPSARKAAIATSLFSALSFLVSIVGTTLTIVNNPLILPFITTVPITSESTENIETEEDKQTLIPTIELTESVTTDNPSIACEQTISDSPDSGGDSHELTIEHEEALICTYDGELSEEDEEISYSFVPLRSGTYRFEISGLYEEREISIYIFDAGDGLVAKREWIGNSGGITTRDLIPGQDYSILVKQEKGFSPYTLSICSQAETVSVNGAKRIIDSTVFTDQENKYQFTPELEGTYRFEINELYAEKQISMYIFDEGDGTVSKKEWIGNGNGITISSLQTKKPYTIVIKQAVGYSPYVLDIGYPNETRLLSENGSINGELTFTDQVDIYSFIPQKEGNYSFKVSNMQTGKEISMFIVDEGGGTVDRHEWIGNDSGVDTSQLQIDKQYYVKIVQEDGFTPYTLSVERRYLSDE